MTSHDQDYLNSVAQRVITDEKDHHSGLKTLHDEIDKLRSQDKSDDDFRKDLSLLGLAIRRDASASHLDGILPRIDLVEDNKRDGVIRLLSGDDDPTDGKGNRIKSAHGETFKYDKDGHLQEFTENHGKDVWKYNADDGKYDLYRNGKKTAESSDDAVVVDDDRGNITRYHSDGSSTSVSHAGRTDRNADGNITYQDLKGGRVRKIEYDGAHPTRITEFDSAEDAKNGKAASIYEYDSDSKKWYRLDNNEQPDKSDPVDIDLDQRNGSEKLTHADGTSQQFFRGGAEIDRDKDNRVSRVEHSNGSVSDNFTYGDDGQLTGFSTHDKNGRNGHRYEVDKDGNLKKDGEVIGKGKISIDDNGEIKVENKGKKEDDSDDQTIVFKRNGTVIESSKQQVDVVQNDGKQAHYKFDENGDLISVQAQGLNLHRGANKLWYDEHGKPVAFSPSIDKDATLTLTFEDGSVRIFSANGVERDGTPEPQPK